MNHVELKDFMECSFLSELCYSPDGSYASLVESTCCEEENSYKQNIHLYSVKDNTWRKMTSAGDAKGVVWLNDTEFIFPAVRSEKDKKKLEAGERFTVYYKMSVNGGEAEEYMKVPALCGKLIPVGGEKFVIVAKYDNNAILLDGLKGEEREAALKQIKEEKDYDVFDEIPFWGNGLGMINKKRSRIYLYDKAENILTPVTDELTEAGDVKVVGSSLLYTATRFTDMRQRTSAIVSYDLQSGVSTVLLEDGEYSVRYVDILDGKVIFLGTTQQAFGSSENPDVFVLEDKKAIHLADLEYGQGSSVGSDCRYGKNTTILSHDNKLYMVITEHCDSVLKSMDANGCFTTILEGEGSVDCFDIHDGRILMIGMRGSNLQEVYAIEDHQTVQLSHFNTDFMESHLVIKPEPMVLEYDGVRIEGFVMKPTDFDESKTYPGILTIHGGPKATFGSTFFHENQYWAQKGYFVFYCNPRGSDGRGDEFADIRGKYGTIDYDDLMNFTDAVLAQYPQIDPNRLAATGGSYGGFMVNWIIGHTDRFACCVSQRSISNWVSKCLTTDIGYYHNMDQQASTPWDNFDKMWWHSPIKYADKAKTPTLFIHSDQDYRCWQAEGLQMFTALKLHGTEARLCFFHGENHELSRSGKPLHRVRRLTEITNWFEAHLK